MNGSLPHRVVWVSIDEWIAERTSRETLPRSVRPQGLMTPASSDEILSMRRRKSGPGVSHHAVSPPHLRRRYSA